MASFFFNVAALKNGNGTLDLTTGTKVMLVKSTYAPANHNDTVVSTNLTAAEIVATNYTGAFGGAGRKAASVTGSQNNSLPGSKFVFTDITWTALGGATNDTIGGAVVLKEVTNDAASIPIAYWGLGVVQTGTTTNSSTGVTGLTGTAGISVGWAVTGTGIPGGTTVAAIVSSTAITLSANATASGSATLTFGTPVPTNGSDFTLTMDATNGNLQITT